MRTYQQALSRVGRYTDPCRRFVDTVLECEVPIVDDSEQKLGAIANSVIQKSNLAKLFGVPRPSTKAGKPGVKRQGTISFYANKSSIGATDNNNNDASQQSLA